MGVTAVVNAAQGDMPGWSYVNTKASYYSRCNIKFLGVPALDVKHYPINQHFQNTANFIDNILKNKGKHILLKCKKKSIFLFFFLGGISGNILKNITIIF